MVVISREISKRAQICFPTSTRAETGKPCFPKRPILSLPRMTRGGCREHRAAPEPETSDALRPNRAVLNTVGQQFARACPRFNVASSLPQPCHLASALIAETVLECGSVSITTHGKNRRPSACVGNRASAASCGGGREATPTTTAGEDLPFTRLLFTSLGLDLVV